MSLSISKRFTSNFVFYQGASTSSEVPVFYPIALAGRAYLLDLKERYAQGLFTRASVPILRDSQDINNLPGEATLNPDDLWRRASESWHLGTGQVHFDRVQTSDPNRFRTSKGVNPWTKWQLSLLQDCQQKLVSTNKNILLAVAGTSTTRTVTDGTTATNTTVTSATAAFTSADVGVAISGGTIPANTAIASVTNATTVVITQAATGTASGVTLTIGGSHLYWTDGTALKFTEDITPQTPTATTVTGAAGFTATAHQSLCTDGFNVWAANGTNGIWQTTTGAITASQWRTGTVTLVRYVHGRLIAADNTGFIYDVSVGGGTALPTALNVNTNLPASTQWVDFAEGLGFIFGACFIGDKSRIYKIGIASDGSALSAPSIAGQLPDGEIIRSLQGYLGFVLVGTDLGVRFCAQDASGNLTIGPLIASGPARCMEPQDRFVWFGWENFDANSTGLGRIDLSIFTQPMQPSYATDLMAGHVSHSASEVTAGYPVTVQGQVGSVVTYRQAGVDYRVFAVEGAGIFAPTTQLVPSGTVDSGLIMYGFPDFKLAMYFDMRHQALPTGASVQVFVNADEAGFNSIGTSAVATTTGVTLPCGQLQATKYEFRNQLFRGTTVTQGPTLIRNTLRSFPTPTRTDRFNLPILLHEDLNLGHGQRHINPKTELDFLAGLVHNHTIVAYQEQTQQFAVYVEDYEWRPHHPTIDGTFWNGLVLLVLKTIIE